MVGVNGDPHGFAGRLQGLDEGGRDASGVHHRHAGMPADDLNVRDLGETPRDFGNAARGKHQRIAPRDDDLVDSRIGADVVERRGQPLARKRLFAPWADHLAAEAEAAVHGTGVRRFQQHAIRVAVDDARHGRMHIVTDGIGALLRTRFELAGIGHELAGDRIIRIGAVDQGREGGRNRDGIARPDLCGRIEPVRADQTCIEQILRCPQRLWCASVAHGVVTGAQRTCSIFRAPVASMTSRSKPRAMPDAGGIMASAARKSSSIG